LLFRTNHRLAGLGLTLLVHAVLILVWQMSRSLPPAPGKAGPAMQWLHLPAPPPRTEAPPIPRQQATQRTARPASARAAGPVATAPVTAEAAPAPAADTAPTPQTETIAERARRSVGDIDRALRKESRPLIVAPPDSPQIRMRKGMELARELAPPRIWEAPKVQELVNNTGDGARRTRVITGRGTYCVTDRSPATNVEMIEMHGRRRFTNCPEHEEPAKPQEWRTARD
jgi:hypothetical protein